MKDKFALMVEGKQAPSKLHDSLQEATTEATRLAKITRQDVYILKVIGKAEISDVKVTHY